MLKRSLVFQVFVFWNLLVILTSKNPSCLLPSISADDYTAIKPRMIETLVDNRAGLVYSSVASMVNWYFSSREKLLLCEKEKFLKVLGLGNEASFLMRLMKLIIIRVGLKVQKI